MHCALNPPRYSLPKSERSFGIRTQSDTPYAQRVLRSKYGDLYQLKETDVWKQLRNLIVGKARHENAMASLLEAQAAVIRRQESDLLESRESIRRKEEEGRPKAERRLDSLTSDPRFN